jgi:sugar phosphate isomerase/epimerase
MVPLALTRRDFITSASGAGAMMLLSGNTPIVTDPRPSMKPSLSVFSKHLHWLDYPAMAETAAACGFDGIDLTVRPGGHVEPERVEVDLPRAVVAIRKAGLDIPMITTAILSARDPLTERILRTAAQLGIPLYRPGWLSYDPGRTVEEGLALHGEELARLAELGARYRIRGSYQNHAGKGVGAPVWDIWLLLKELRSEWMGCQYDIRHAMVEGANSWPLGLDLVRPFVNSLVIKDFGWFKEGSRWEARSVPLGEGMVDFKAFLSVLKKDTSSLPISMHLEYPLGGADKGERKLAVSGSVVVEALKKDIAFARLVIG